MNELMTLTSSGCQATFDPNDGGRLTSFRVSGRELLVQHGKDAFHWGSFVIAPWVGRLRDATFTYNGARYRFPANSGPHALHGMVTERPWQVLDKGRMSIELDKPWPWPCRIVQTTELGDNSAQFRIEVHASEPMPAAVAWHPWFATHLDGKTTGPEVELDARPGLMWANDDTGLPTGDLVDPPPRPWDYCFRNLSSDPVVRWAGELELTVRSSCTNWVFYDMESAGVCIEPWTAPPNSLNMPQPQIVLPGPPMVTTMSWHWN